MLSLKHDLDLFYLFTPDAVEYKNKKTLKQNGGNLLSN